jgi:hypothetical protein
MDAAPFPLYERWFEEVSGAGRVWSATARVEPLPASYVSA